MSTTELQKKIDKFISHNLNDFGFAIQPGKYLQKSEYCDVAYGVRYLQNRVRAALFFFLNGSYWLEGDYRVQDMLYPLCDIVEARLRNIFSGLQSVVININMKFGIFEEFLHQLDKHNRFSQRHIATLLSTFYSEFEEITVKLKREGKIEKNHCMTLQESDYPVDDKKYLEPLWKLQDYAGKYLKKYLKGFYLHGSLATMDYIPYWSDVDTLMILKKETILNPSSLIELRKRTILSQQFMYRIDPLQLHGHLLISEFDLDYYPQTYFPLILFDYSKSFFHDQVPLHFYIRDCETEKIASFWNDAVSYFLGKAKNYQNGRRDVMQQREKKLFLHRLLTFPLFYLQAKGEYMYKKYSFEKAQADFSEEEWSIIERATSLMKGWNYCHSVNGYLQKVLAFNPKLYLYVINKFYDIKYMFSEGVFRGFEKEYEEWIVSAVVLSISGWNMMAQSSRLRKVSA